MPLYDKSPTPTEFFTKYTELLAKYNGTLPGAGIPANIVKDGAFWSLVIGMLAMGLATNPWKVLKYAKRPLGPSIGVVCQFLIMPCITMVAVAAVNFGGYEALVIMLYGCAPGGGISNIIIYWMGGDIDLSITMTMLSCILALGFTPLWMLVVPKLLADQDNVDVPFEEIAVNIAAVVLPAVLGSFIFWLGQRWNFPKVVKIASMVIATVTTIVIIVILILGIYKYYLSAIITVAQVVYSAILPLIGFGISYLLSFLTVMAFKRCGKDFNIGTMQFITIGVETGVQNGRMVNAITLILYNGLPYETAQTFFFPILAFAWQLFYGILGAIVMRLCRKHLATPEEDGIQNSAFSLK